MVLLNYTAGTPPPRSSGTVRANPSEMANLAFRGEQAKISGVGAFGRGVSAASDVAFKATMQRQALDDSIEYGNATQRVLADLREAEDAADRLDVSIDMPLKDDPKYLETLTAFSTEKRDALTLAGMNGISGNAGEYTKGFSRPENQAKFENWFNNMRGTFEYSLKSRYGQKLNDYQVGELKKLSSDAAMNGDVETANQYIDLMDARELITHEAAVKYKADNKDVADESITSQMAQAIINLQPVM